MVEVVVYDEGALLRRIGALDRSRKTAFAAACAERLWPLYERYALAVRTPSTQVDALRAALDTVWQCALGGAGDVASVEELAESMIPREDDQWLLESGYGQNAIAAVAYAAHTWLTDQPQEAVWAARQVLEAADYAAQRQVGEASTYSAEIENALSSAPVVRAAARAMDADLEAATRAGPLDVRAQSRLGAAALAALFP